MYDLCIHTKRFIHLYNRGVLLLVIGILLQLLLHLTDLTDQIN